MIKMKQCVRALFTIALATLLLAAARPAPAAEGALSLVPKDSEVVIGIHARQILDSELFTKLAASVPQLNAGVAVVQNLTGVNVLTDIDNIVLFGNIADRETGGAIIEGRINAQKLLLLLQSAPSYKAVTAADGRTAYAWYDEREKRMKFGMFLDNGGVAVWNSQAAMDASLAVLKDAASSFAASPDAKLIPGDAEKTAIWLVLVNRQNKGPAAKYRIASILGTETLGPAELNVTLTVIPQDAADTPKWVAMGRGVLAFGLLQGDPNLNYLAAHGKVDASNDGKSMTWMTTIGNDKLLGALKK